MRDRIITEVGLKFDDYTVGDHRFTVITKGNKVRFVQIGGHSFSPEDFEKMAFLFATYKQDLEYENDRPEQP